MSDPGDIQRVRRQAERLQTAQQIDAVIERMASAAIGRLSDRRPVVVPILLGGAFTAVRMCAHFDFAYELDCLRVGRYGAGVTGGTLCWMVRPSVDLAGRSVLLVDDVLDQGATLRAVVDELDRLGVADLHVAVLVSKHVADRAPRPSVDIVGLECPDRYLFGCGMDYKGFWRGLPELYAVADRDD